MIELRSRVTSLQTELDNGETVQKDFVLLSQSLQQELERIRGADTQVLLLRLILNHYNDLFNIKYFCSFY